MAKQAIIILVIVFVLTDVLIVFVMPGSLFSNTKTNKITYEQVLAEKDSLSRVVEEWQLRYVIDINCMQSILNNYERQDNQDKPKITQ